jgi:GTP:adenosylcobinamide-phosphate guanylyltransferase
MNVLITAGGRPLPNEPLYAETQGGYKAMLDIAGKPMIGWVLEAVSASPQVEQIVIVGLPETSDVGHCPKLAAVIDDRGDLVSNVMAAGQEALRLSPNAKQALLISSDVPAISTEGLEWLMQQMSGSEDDVFYTVVERSVMERRFPGAKRTYAHLKGLEVCGGDVFGFRLDLVQNPKPIWQKMVETRKNPLRQAALFGFDTMFLLMLRQLSLEEAEKMVGQRLGVRGRALLSPYAEMAMDVDKPHQLAILRNELSAVRSA